MACWLLVPNKGSCLCSSRLEFAVVSLLVKFCFLGKELKSPKEVLKVELFVKYNRQFHVCFPPRSSPFPECSHRAKWQVSANEKLGEV